MVVPLTIDNPGGGSATSELIWTFSGTVSTDQNPNIPRFVPKVAQVITELQVNSVSAPVGGDCTVVWKLNGAIVGTVVLLAGERLKREAVSITIVDGDEFWPEITSLTTVTPPTTLAMVAR